MRERAAAHPIEVITFRYVPTPVKNITRVVKE
jgi:hypothetical protein